MQTTQKASQEDRPEIEGVLQSRAIYEMWNYSGIWYFRNYLKLFILSFYPNEPNEKLILQIMDAANK